MLRRRLDDSWIFGAWLERTECLANINGLKGSLYVKWSLYPTIYHLHVYFRPWPKRMHPSIHSNAPQYSLLCVLQGSSFLMRNRWPWVECHLLWVVGRPHCVCPFWEWLWFPIWNLSTCSVQSCSGEHGGWPCDLLYLAVGGVQHRQTRYSNPCEPSRVTCLAKGW